MQQSLGNRSPLFGKPHVRKSRRTFLPTAVSLASSSPYNAPTATLVPSSPLLNITMAVACTDPARFFRGAPQSFMEVPSLRTPPVSQPRPKETTHLPIPRLPADEVEECGVQTMVVAETSFDRLVVGRKQTKRMVPSHQRYTVDSEAQKYFNEQCIMGTDECPAFWGNVSSLASGSLIDLVPDHSNISEQPLKWSDGGADTEGFQAGTAVAALANLAKLSEMILSGEYRVSLERDQHPVLDDDETPVNLQQDAYAIMVDCFSNLADLSNDLIAGITTEHVTMAPIAAALHGA